MKYTKRHEFIPTGTIWPEWSNFLVGVAGGFEAFENESDYEKFLKSYRRKHKNDKIEPCRIVETETSELPRTGKIGFAA